MPDIIIFSVETILGFGTLPETVKGRLDRVKGLRSQVEPQKLKPRGTPQTSHFGPQIEIPQKCSIQDEIQDSQPHTHIQLRPHLTHVTGAKGLLSRGAGERFLYFGYVLTRWMSITPKYDPHSPI